MRHTGSYPQETKTGCVHCSKCLLLKHNRNAPGLLMKVITSISNQENWWYNNMLVPSCRYHGLDLETLVFEEPWHTHRNKDVLLLNYLEGVDPDEIILFTDGYDTLFLTGEEEILGKFHTFETPLVFTAEKNCWPDLSLAHRFPESPTISRYLNSGGFIGYAGVIKALLTKHPQPPVQYAAWKKPYWQMKKWLFGKEFHPARKYPFSNQYYWSRIYLRHPESVSLDYFSTIFQELTTPRVNFSPDQLHTLKEQCVEEQKAKDKARIFELFGIEDYRLVHRATGERPCQLHFNGKVIKMLIHEPEFQGLIHW